jgi:TorA maturation chaperone TorD
VNTDIHSPDEVDMARAQEYVLLSSLLLKCPNAALLERLALLRGDSTELGRVHTVLGQAAARTNAESVTREHFTLFSGLGRGELLPYASYYLTGFVQGRPLADVRQAFAQLGIERTEGQAEPEDHAGVLLDVMAGFASGSLGAPEGTDREFFGAHLGSWIARFFSDLERSPSAKFYASVGTLGRTFVEIERGAFELLEPHA